MKRKRPPETKKNQRRYVSLHKTDDSVISERDVSSYSLFGKGNRFEEYKQKRMEDQKIEQRERKMRDERGKEGVRERMSTKREREAMSTRR